MKTRHDKQWVEDIIVSQRLRDRLDEDRVEKLANSIQEIGLQHPIHVRWVEDADGGQSLYLVAGRHRLAACERLGMKQVDVIVMDGAEIDCRLWEIAENLHRAELTAQERAEHIAEWVRLIETKDGGGAGQIVQPQPAVVRSDGKPLDLGISKAARELPVKGDTEDAKRKTVERALQIDSLSPEAKQAAKETGMDTKQTILLKAARAPAADQAAVIRAEAANRLEKARKEAEGKARRAAAELPTRKPRAAKNPIRVAWEKATPGQRTEFYQWLSDNVKL